MPLRSFSDELRLVVALSEPVPPQVPLGLELPPLDLLFLTAVVMGLMGVGDVEGFTRVILKFLTLPTTSIWLTGLILSLSLMLTGVIFTVSGLVGFMDVVCLKLMVR